MTLDSLLGRKQFMVVVILKKRQEIQHTDTKWGYDVRGIVRVIKILESGLQTWVLNPLIIA